MVQPSYPPSAKALVLVRSAFCKVLSDRRLRGYSREEGPLDDGSAAHLYLHQQVLRALTHSKTIPEVTQTLLDVSRYRFVQHAYKQARSSTTAIRPPQLANATNTNHTAHLYPEPASPLLLSHHADREGNNSGVVKQCSLAGKSGM